ncbi:hypothetical protein BBBOND_0206240 [Babesia bigemina]|uniref:Uncharacterized protein n=1 Tax=Babesia bigemina TaxID=5866 RepID=A0A061D405_BABBI|nr:hypothetical protein BBBOND_0206240 [Babesia bigemina]CDR95466.1 hypothetical protein BBBOND_0206240 [Babesia bigemina]|eukprot:XP_012767652.1 hypothetical protein BBBOND_0206240 [Babesia bigemina]
MQWLCQLIAFLLCTINVVDVSVATPSPSCSKEGDEKVFFPVHHLLDHLEQRKRNVDVTDRGAASGRRPSRWSLREGGRTQNGRRPRYDYGRQRSPIRTGKSGNSKYAVSRARRSSSSGIEGGFNIVDGPHHGGALPQTAIPSVKNVNFEPSNIHLSPSSANMKREFEIIPVIPLTDAKIKPKSRYENPATHYVLVPKVVDYTKYAAVLDKDGNSQNGAVTATLPSTSPKEGGRNDPLEGQHGVDDVQLPRPKQLTNGNNDEGENVKTSRTYPGEIGKARSFSADNLARISKSCELAQELRSNIINHVERCGQEPVPLRVRKICGSCCKKKRAVT